MSYGNEPKLREIPDLIESVEEPLSFFSDKDFAGFGTNRLGLGFTLPAVPHVTGRRPGQLRAGVREACTRKPGVYGFVNTCGELIYVGKAKNLRQRLLSYFRPRSRPAKAGRVIAETRRIVWEYAPNEFAALLRELELIQSWQPRWNFQGQPRRRRRIILCLGRPPAPYLYLSRRPSRTAMACWGPLFQGRQSQEAVKKLNDLFGLRDCPQDQPMVFADQSELFPIVHPVGCIRYEINTCIGPCTGKISSQAYHDRIQAVREFLDGNDPGPLQKLEQDMAAASAALEFERAGQLRDKLTALQWLHAHLERMRQARDRSTFVYPVKGHDGQVSWYLIRRGWVAKAIRAPRDAAAKQEANKVLKQVFEKPSLGVEPTGTEGVDGVLLVSTWFRKHPHERKRILTVDKAKRICVKG